MSRDKGKPGARGAAPLYRMTDQGTLRSRVEAGDIDAIVARLARLLGRQLARDIHAAAHDKKLGG